LSFFKKKDSNPPINGITNSNKTIIKSKCKSQNAKEASLSPTFYFLIFNFLLPQKELQYKEHQHADHHQQYITPYLPAL
jgi:hypothetical protein